MGIIQQKGQFSGRSYSVQIAGDTPTAAEQQKIDSFLTQQEQPYKRLRELEQLLRKREVEVV